jgi:diguanylate cyclase (GGDEF)-like protein/PAS domain S-box-containing protein
MNEPSEAQPSSAETGRSDGGLSALLDALAALAADPAGLSELTERLRQTLPPLRAAALALQAEAGRYRILLEAVPDPVLLLDREGRVLDANEAAVSALGYPRDRLLSMSITDIAPARGPALMSEFWARARIGESLRDETVNQRSDGSGLPAEVWSRTFIEDGEARVFAVVRDLSGARRLIEDLERAQREYAELLRSIDQGILVQDAEGRILEANPAARSLLGLPAGELPPLPSLTPDWQIVDGDGVRLRREDLPARVAIETGKAVHHRLLGVLDRASGRYRWLEVTAIPQFRERDAKPTRVISVIQDVTDLQRDHELFARVQRLARIAGFEWWPQTGTVFCTPQWGELCAEEGARELSWDAFVHHFVEEDRARLIEAFEGSVRHPGDLALECRVQGAGGRRCWVRILGHAVRVGGEAVRLSGTIQDITEEKLREEELQIRADTDLLTGLLTREAILRALAALTERPGARVAVLHLDLDRFKLVNDLFGHETGDRLLAAVAARLRAAVSARVSIGRLTGDEFLVVLPDELARRAETVAEVLVRAFERPFRIGDQEFPLGLSIGLARVPEDASDLRQLLMQADAALQEAKRRGRKGWVGVSGTLTRELGERIAIEANLRRALEREEFELVFQPQIDLRNGRIVGAEALLRWHSPTLGTVPPDRFIPQAEASGDIVRIGRWIIDEACRRLALWRRGGLALERLSLNLSYRQLVSSRVADEVLRALFEHELPGELLEVEITERILAEEVSDVRPILQALRAAGVGIAIDDFGEGYSALDRLRRLPIQALKISHRFTAGVPHVASDVAICQAIIGVARGLGLEVIAEGVENEAQRSFMQRHGVRIVQGYLFSRPLPAEEFAQFYRERRSVA